MEILSLIELRYLQISKFTDSSGIPKKYFPTDGYLDDHWRPVYANCGLCKQK